MKKLFTLYFVLISSFVIAQLKSPSEFLGYELGSEFSRHSDVIDYFKHVASQSDMVQFQSYGKTNERRPLTYALVSSPQNLANIETIRTNNLKQTGILEGTANPDIAIVWLSYNVHGNEASTMEAAMQTIYELVTLKKEWLQNTVVIIDPCVNPDGRDRYANWYNQVKATPYNTAQIAAEHYEPWPGGRSNHYYFDLNRDWAWASQIETQERLKIYNQWMPHVHVDYHEQGFNEPYYFAPAAEPFHEIITPWQRDFQTEIGKNHAKYFDQEGWLFFTRQSFDLLYPSYGDTYPTFMGAIGMTYEQAGHGRAGLGVQTDEGYLLTLKDRIAHHHTTGLSSVEMASKNAKKLNEEFRKFFQNNGLKYKSFVLQGNADKINALSKWLDKHEIKYDFSNQNTVSGYHYQTQKKGTIDGNQALVVSTNQPKGKMVSVLFEPEAKLNEPLTYDITAWSIPYAYGLDCVASETLIAANGSNPFVKTISQRAPLGSLAGYIFTWNSMQEAAFLSALLKENIKVRFTERELKVQGKTFANGSLIITKSDNQKNPTFTETVTKLSNQYERTPFIANTSFSDNGVDFGSYDIKLVPKTKIVVLKGDGVASLNYGAIWHFMEQQLEYPITTIDTEYFSISQLANYDVLVMPSGWYSEVLDSDGLDALKNWIRKGGKLIAMGNAIRSFEGKSGFGITRNKSEDDDDEEDDSALIPYGQRERANVENFITGSIFKISLDPTHPMAFGFNDAYYSLKLGSTSYQFLENGYNVGYIQGDAQRISGFAGKAALEKLKNSLVFGTQNMGRGSVVYMVDDVLFRSFWENGKLLFVNSLFFVNN